MLVLLHVLRSSTSPTIPILVLDKSLLHFVSLYKDTFPPITGVLNCDKLQLIPSADFSICQKISGFSGLPKFKQSVIAMAPHQNKRYYVLLLLLQFSRLFLDLNKCSENYNLLSLLIAFFVPRTRTTAASEPGATTVFVRTMIIILIINPFFTCNRWLL